MSLKIVFACVLAAAALAVNVSAQQVTRGTLRPADAARFRADAGPSVDGWRVEARAASGAVTRIRGAVELTGSTAEARFSDFLIRYGAAFDMNPPGAGPIAWSPLRILTHHPDGSPRHVRATQLVHGFEATGHGLTLELDRAGRAVCVHGIASAAIAALPTPSIPEARAVAEAEARFLARGHAASSFVNPPKVARRVARYEGGAPALVYVVEGVTKSTYQPLACDVNALTGAVLREYENKCTFFGEGTFKQGGQTGAFKTGNGKGVVYKNFVDATANKALTQPLPELAFETAQPIIAEDGHLFGRFSWILWEVVDQQTVSYFPVQGNKHQFLGFPSDVNPDLADFFDATNCYFHLTKFALGMTKIAKQVLPTDFAMPTIVNSPQFQPQDFNAFFSSSDAGFGTGEGFMLFGDPSFATGALADDFSRDPSVMCHEYTHSISTFTGLGFGAGPSNIPNRAVNEAIADYFAASFFKDPRIGLALFELGSAGFIQALGLTSDGLRNIAAPKTLFDNLMDVTEGGIPEEHAAGHIFACALWNVRVAVKQKAADELIFNSLFNWPSDITEIGYQTFGPGNAVAAYIEYFEACLAQLIEDAFASKGKAFGLKVLGATLKNNCIGMPDALPDLVSAFDLDLSKPGTTTYSSGFIGGSDGHLLGVGVNSDQVVDVTITGDKKANTKVDVAFLFNPGDLSFPNAPVKTANSYSIKGVQVNQGGGFGLIVINDGIISAVLKPYKATIRVK